MAINDVYTPNLDRYKAVQDRPIGMNTALYRDPATEQAGREYRREQSDFNMARRLLRREAGRGGATGIAAADRLLNLAPMAEERGVQYGGVQRAGAREVAVGGRMTSRKQEMADMELGRQAGRKELNDRIAGVSTPRLDSNPARRSVPATSDAAGEDFVYPETPLAGTPAAPATPATSAGDLLARGRNAPTRLEQVAGPPPSATQGMSSEGSARMLEMAGKMGLSGQAANDWIGKMRETGTARRRGAEINAGAAGIAEGNRVDQAFSNLDASLGRATDLQGQAESQIRGLREQANPNPLEGGRDSRPTIASGTTAPPMGRPMSQPAMRRDEGVPPASPATLRNRAAQEANRRARLERNRNKNVGGLEGTGAGWLLNQLQREYL